MGLLKRKCGHFERVQNHQIKTNATYHEDRLCYECYKDEQYDKAVEANTDLPELEGSEKQIKWAESIRAKVIKGFGDEGHWVSKARAGNVINDPSNIITGNILARTATYLNDIIDRVKSTSSAKWLINNRNDIDPSHCNFKTIFNKVVLGDGEPTCPNLSKDWSQAA